MSEAWKEVRVFISSTFKDMHAERDHLVRFVFPRLREVLLKRRVHFVDVDLRWGVTADQDAFALCMDEIERCQPRFICMLGGRYGWVPPPRTIDRAFLDRVLAGDTPAMKLTDEQRQVFDQLYSLDETEGVYRLGEKPQVKDDVQTWNDQGNLAVQILQVAGLPDAKHSITASEIHFGALGRLDKPTYRYFYFRKPEASNSIPVPHARDYREPVGSFAEEALEALKNQVRKSEGLMQTAPGRVEMVELPTYDYPCRWDEQAERLVDLEEFGEHVYDDLLAGIEAELGAAASEELDHFAKENEILEAEIERHTERYVVGERAPVFEALTEHAEGSGGNPYFLLAGDPGSGKSALLAKFLRDYVGTEHRPAHPDHLVISHFVGVNATNLREVLQRICHEVVVGADLSDEVPADYEELRKALPELLEKAAKVRKVVLVLDAVNQLDQAHGAWAMTWLPDSLPGNVRVILSAIDLSAALEALRQRREPPTEEPLHPLSNADATSIIDSFLERYRKNLDDDQRALFLGKEHAGKPLYLLTALEEVRTLGTYEEISDRIGELPGEVQPLFNWILKRLEKDPGFRDAEGKPIGQEIVGPYTSYLSLGRNGMAQLELVGLVAPGGNGDEPDPQGNLAALRALLLPYLMRRGKLLDFYHGQIREAVQRRYLTGEVKRIIAHRAISDYFETQLDPDSDGSCKGDSLRSLSELPFHLTEAMEWERVYKTLTNFTFLERKVTEVGVVETTDSEGEVSRLYTGVLKLQDDYDHALGKMPASSSIALSKHPVFLTPTDFGDGYVIQCPFCNKQVPFQEKWLDQEMRCPELNCGGPWKVNPFKCERSSWAKKKGE